LQVVEQRDRRVIGKEGADEGGFKARGRLADLGDQRRQGGGTDLPDRRPDLLHHGNWQGLAARVAVGQRDDLGPCAHSGSCWVMQWMPPPPTAISAISTILTRRSVKMSWKISRAHPSRGVP